MGVGRYKVEYLKTRLKKIKSHLVLKINSPSLILPTYPPTHGNGCFTSTFTVEVTGAERLLKVTQLIIDRIKI